MVLGLYENGFKMSAVTSGIAATRSPRPSPDNGLWLHAR